jgi:lipid A ethanolaminephosphotransferase
MLKQLKLKYYVLLVSFINLLLYQYPFFKFVLTTSNTKSFNGIILLISLIIASIVLNAFVFYIGLYLLRNVGKWLLAIFFNISAIAVYFINTYGVIIDRSMIGNVFNTNYEESSSFLSLGLLLYILFLGLLPSFLLFKFEIIRPQLKSFLISTGLTLLFLGILVFANSSNWLWIDKNSKTLGGLVMPWSYVVNTSRYYSHINKKNKKQILLPDATIKNDEKTVAVLVIGESARSSNFSLYGYDKEYQSIVIANRRSKTFRGRILCYLHYCRITSVF